MIIIKITMVAMTTAMILITIVSAIGAKSLATLILPWLCQTFQSTWLGRWIEGQRRVPPYDTRLNKPTEMFLK